MINARVAGEDTEGCPVKLETFPLADSAEDFNPHKSAGQSARVVHFTSADYPLFR